jgi:hypothetical protein
VHWGKERKEKKKKPLLLHTHYIYHENEERTRPLAVHGVIVVGATGGVRGTAAVHTAAPHVTLDKLARTTNIVFLFPAAI